MTVFLAQALSSSVERGLFFLYFMTLQLRAIFSSMPCRQKCKHKAAAARNINVACAKKSCVSQRNPNNAVWSLILRVPLFMGILHTCLLPTRILITLIPSIILCTRLLMGMLIMWISPLILHSRLLTGTLIMWISLLFLHNRLVTCD